MLCWTVSKVGGPKRACHASVAVRNKLYSFGGLCDRKIYRCDRKIYKEQMMMDVHVFNTESLCWKKLPPVKPERGDGHLEAPLRRCDHTAVLIEDTVYIWGGFPYSNVLYAFDVDAQIWFKPRVSGSVSEIWYHSACVLGKVMFIHGGLINLTRWTNDIYKLDTSTMVWSLINTRGTAPPPTSCHSATIIGTKMFVFGGHSRGHCINIRVFDTETNYWINTPSTQPLQSRWNHSDFTYNGELYIHGGEIAYKKYNDLWKFSPETNSWKKVEPKGIGPYTRYRMCCCMVGDRIILFGGDTEGLYVLDFSPSLKKLCNIAVIQYDLEQSELPHNIRWELAAMTGKATYLQPTRIQNL